MVTCSPRHIAFSEILGRPQKQKEVLVRYELADLPAPAPVRLRFLSPAVAEPKSTSLNIYIL